MFTHEMLLLLGLLAAQHCNEIGIVSDSSLAKAREITSKVEIKESEIAKVFAYLNKNGLPNAVQCAGFEFYLSAQVPGA